MNDYLLDTSVVSELAPDRRFVAQGLSTFLRRHTAQLHLSVLSIVEIEQGVAQLRRAGGVARADRLADWIARLTTEFGPRVISVDRTVARIAGVMTDAVVAIGRHPGLADVLIAATAKARGMTVVTRNLRHFEPLGIDLLDPAAWSAP